MDNLQLLGYAKLGQRQQIRLPDEVIEKLEISKDTPVLFFSDKENKNIVIMKKGKVVAYE